jgi:hypothetical protein
MAPTLDEEIARYQSGPYCRNCHYYDFSIEDYPCSECDVVDFEENRLTCHFVEANSLRAYVIEAKRK